MAGSKQIGMQVCERGVKETFFKDRWFVCLFTLIVHYIIVTEKAKKERAHACFQTHLRRMALHAILISYILKQDLNVTETLYIKNVMCVSPITHANNIGSLIVSGKYMKSFNYG